MASWTQNTNVNILVYTPLQLVTLRKVVFPGIFTGISATDSLYDDESVWRIMERMKELREAEFRKSMNKKIKLRSKGYEDEIIKKDTWCITRTKIRMLGWAQ